MKFEISPVEYHIRLTWDEARIYCFSLNIDGKTGWRLPTEKEGYRYIRQRYTSWYKEDGTGIKPEDLRTATFICVPVRDIT